MHVCTYICISMSHLCLWLCVDIYSDVYIHIWGLVTAVAVYGFMQICIRKDVCVYRFYARAVYRSYPDHSQKMNSRSLGCSYMTPQNLMTLKNRFKERATGHYTPKQPTIDRKLPMNTGQHAESSPKPTVPQNWASVSIFWILDTCEGWTI